jgi:repressor LexA
LPQPLNPIERQVYHYLIDFLAQNTYQPSVREIGEQLRIKSTRTVTGILQSLADKGYVEREPGRSRGVRLLGYTALGSTRPVPLYVALNPAEPLLTDENRERFVAMDRGFVPGDDAFFLRADDDSMKARGIQRGDLVLVNPSARVRDGDVVVARVRRDTVMRVLYRRDSRLALSTMAAGADETVLGATDDFAIIGGVTSVLRPFGSQDQPPAGV